MVLTGPIAGAVTSRGTTRPLVIDHVYLFNGEQILEAQRSRGVKLGVASSVPNRLWTAAEIYLTNHEGFPLTDEQRELLLAFGTPPPT